MHEHTIPESLIEQIRTGRAALVVGAGIGVPSWKQMLERMTKALETRGRDGDDVATGLLLCGAHRPSRGAPLTVSLTVAISPLCTYSLALVSARRIARVVRTPVRCLR